MAFFYYIFLFYQLIFLPLVSEAIGQVSGMIRQYIHIWQGYLALNRTFYIRSVYGFAVGHRLKIT